LLYLYGMKFEHLLLIAALLMAVCGGAFSIIGISTLFGGTPILSGTMAGIIEFAKIIGTTFLYRYWTKTMGYLKTYLIISVFILMVITSAGIYGFLGSSYQGSSLKYKAQQEQIVLTEKTKVYTQTKIDQSQNRMLILNKMRESQESRMSEAMTNSYISRNPIQLKQLQDQTAEMIKTTEADTKIEQNKIDTAITEIAGIDQKVNQMKYSDTSKDIRTFEFIAKLFNTTLDNVAKWFIFLLIIVFDPLAVALILAYNVMIYKESQELVHLDETPSKEISVIEPLKKV